MVKAWIVTAVGDWNSIAESCIDQVKEKVAQISVHGFQLAFPIHKLESLMGSSRAWEKTDLIA